MSAMPRVLSKSEMDELLELTERPSHTRPLPMRRPMPRPAEAMSRFDRWARSPITAYRVGLTATYLITIYFGVSALAAGVPAFDLTAPHGWTPVWATIVIIGGVAGTFGSFSDAKLFNRVELFGAWILFLTLGGYAAVLLFIAYGAGDPGRAAVGAGFVALGVTPGVRLLWLLSQSGRR